MAEHGSCRPKPSKQWPCQNIYRLFLFQPEMFQATASALQEFVIFCCIGIQRTHLCFFCGTSNEMLFPFLSYAYKITYFQEILGLHLGQMRVKDVYETMHAAGTLSCTCLVHSTSSCVISVDTRDMEQRNVVNQCMMHLQLLIFSISCPLMNSFRA